MDTREQNIAVSPTPSGVTWVKGEFVFTNGGGVERAVTRRIPTDATDVPSLIAAFIEDLRTVGVDFPEGRATLCRLLMWGTDSRRGAGA